jgi:hypothetical protein
VRCQGLCCGEKSTVVNQSNRDGSLHARDREQDGMADMPLEPQDRLEHRLGSPKSRAARASRQQRLDHFGGEGEPPAGEPIELLCEDHVGTYVVPFPCQWVDRAWRNFKSGEPIEARVVGWRRHKATKA